MKKFAILTVLVFIFSLISATMVMAQAKPAPAKEPAKAPAKAPAPKEPIKLGAIYCFAGPCYMYSESAINGIRIAAEEINAKGGILGRKLDVIVRDTEMKVDVGAREVKDLILREKVNFLEGPCSSGVGLAMQVVHSEYKVIRVTTMANTEGQVVDKFTPYIVQIVPNTYMEGIAATRYLNKKVPTAKEIYEEVKRILPTANIKFKPDRELTQIVRSWPKYLKETKAFEDWGWKTKFHLKETVEDFVKEVQAHPEIYG